MEGYDLKQIIAPKGDDAMSCCFDRKKLSCGDKYSLKKALSEIVLQNSEYEKELKEKKRLEDDEMLSVSKRRLQKESRTQIYGDSIRQIAKGFGRNAVICEKPKDEKPSPKKAQKKAKKGKKRVEVIHLTKEQARRRYTMPKGRSYDFNVDEASIWGATDFKKDMPNRILDLDTFEDDNVFKDVNKYKASDKNGFDAGDDKK